MKRDGVQCWRWRVWAELVFFIGLLGAVGTASAQEERTFTLNNVDVRLADVSAEADVYFRSMRLNRALDVWNVEASVSNKVGRVISGPLVLLVEGFTNTTGPRQADGTIEGEKHFYDLSGLTSNGALAPGEVTAPRTLTLGRSGSGSPTLDTRVYAGIAQASAALGVTRSLNAAGQPLPGVRLSIAGPGGAVEQSTDGDSGVSSFGQGAGEHVVKFSAAGYLPVWRRQTLLAEETTLMPNARLTGRSEHAVSVTPLGGTVVKDAAETIAIEFGAGAVSQGATVTLTPLTGQSLPAFLPLGWSPLNAFWLESTMPLGGSVSGRLKPWGTIGTGETAALAKWDETGLRWVVLRTVAGNGANAVTVNLEGAGAYALVVADVGETAPLVARVGETLGGFSPTTVVDAAGLTARGSVSPAASPASLSAELVTGTAEVELRHASERLPSGYLLRGEVTETYLLSDGSLRLTPQYEHYIVGYQRPGDQDPFSLHASFPMRPVLLFGPETLEEATVRVDVLPEQPFEGAVLDANGGQVSAGGVRLLAGSGRLTGPSAVRLRRLDATLFEGLMEEGHGVLAAFELTLDGSTLGDTLTLQVSGVPENRLFVLARVLSETGYYGLEPVERLITDGQGNLGSLEPREGERLAGVRGSGQYVLVEVGVRQGLVSGIARNGAGEVQGGMPVRLTGLPWLSVTDAEGRFQLVGPMGAGELSVLDPRTGDTGLVAVEVIDPGLGVAQDLGTAAQGPRVARITPAEGALRVPRVGSVVVEFNEAVNPGTVAGAIELVKPDESVVAAALTLNMAGTVATLSPAVELEANTEYRVRLAGTIADPGGLPIEGATEFTFTTVALSTRDPAAQLIIYEPGATNVPPAVLAQIPAYEPGEDPFAIVVRGTPGVADPEVPVILVNESTGETATVLSKVDGSFASVITGTEEDFVSATFVNLNGTRVYVPVSRQEFDNGFVGLYPQGGVLEAEKDGSEVQVIIEPGAIPGKTVFGLEPIPVTQLLQKLGNQQPVGGKVMGGFEYDESGDELKEAADVALIVDIADFELPSGRDPSDAVHVLTVPRDYDGVVVYDVLDTMAFEDAGNGKARLVTRSPPFPGLLARRLASLREAVGRIDRLGSVSTSSTSPTAVGIAVGSVVLTIDMPLSQGAQLAGFVKSGLVDESGAALEPLRPVAGALVMLDDAGTDRPAGFLRAGELVCTTDRRGNFVTFFRPSDQGRPREILATHPRFPFQRVRAGVQLDAVNTAVGRVLLTFAEGIATGGPVSGLARPVLQAGHSPALPATGSGEGAGADLIITAIDDKQIDAVEAEIVEVTGANGELLSLDVVEAVLVGSDESNLGRIARRYRVTASARARVEFKVTAVDDEGQEAALSYVIHFGLAGGITPTDPNDTLGPYVALVWPPPSAENVPALSPILVRFSEPVPDLYLEPANWNWVNFGSPHSLQQVTRGGDAREVVLHYRGPTEDKVQVTVGAPLTDANGNDFDQDPASEGLQAFDWEFTQAEVERAGLAGDNGMGVVMAGRYGYGLDRDGLNAKLTAYDFEEPSEPEEFDSRSFEGGPGSLTIMPDYPLAVQQMAADGTVTIAGCELASYLAVFTGSSFEPKRLTVLPAKGSVNEGLLAGGWSPPAASAVLSPADSLSQIVRSKWDAPFLSYLELGADCTSITLLNLPAFYFGARLAREDFRKLKLLPSEGDFGLDENGDGDYCDAGDRPPLPANAQALPFGFAFSWTPDSCVDRQAPEERIQDFDVVSDLGLVGVITAFNDNSSPGRLRIVLSATDPNPLDEAEVLFDPSLRPRRLLLLPATRLETDSGPIVRDLAIVSLSRPGGDGLLSIIDVTVHSAPVALAEIELPVGEGTPGSLVRRGDGRLALSTSRSILLTEPSKLLLSGEGTVHPAFVGIIDTAGGGSQSFVADTSGINAVFSGGTRVSLQTAPRIQVVTFDRDPFKPESLLPNGAAGIAEVLSEARAVSVLELARTDEEGGIVPDLSPDRHYYVLVDAPGGEAEAGQELPLVVATVSHGGQFQEKSVRNMVPSVLGDESVHEALFLKQLIRLLRVLNSNLDVAAHNSLGRELTLFELAESLVSSESLEGTLPEMQELLGIAKGYPLDFKARRLSDDPTSSMYNRYLAGPFLILPSSPDKETLDTLLQQAEQLSLGRRYLRAGPRVWVGFPSEADGHPVVGAFASQFRLNPSLTLGGVSVPLISSLAESLVQGLIGGSSVLGPVLLGVVNQFTSMAADFEPTLLPGANRLHQVTYRERPLVFVPGFAGSRLNQQQGEVWPGFLSGISKTNLAVQPGGVPVLPTSPPDALRHVLEIGDLRIGEIYGGLIRNLQRSLGYVEYDYINPAQAGDPFKSYQAQRRRFNGAPQLGQEPAPDLFVYAYDWRLDNATSAKLLEEYVKIALFYHPEADGVDLMAHSNGNLVSREYMNTHPGRVARFISLAAPWAGSGKPLAGVLTGDMEDLALNLLIPIQDLRRASQFMPGFHQLMPTKALFDLGFPVLSLAGFDLSRDGEFYSAYNYAKYAEALEQHIFRDTHAEVGFAGESSPARANHEDFHRPGEGLPISRADGDGPEIEVHQMIGMQSSPQSFAGIRYVGRLHRLATNIENTTLELPFVRTYRSEQVLDPGLRVDDADGSLGITGNQFRFYGDLEMLRTLGDGTVPILSLARGYGSGMGDYNAPHARLYCAVSLGSALNKEVGHNDLLGTPLLNGWVERVLTGRRIPVLDLTVETPALVGEGDAVNLTASAAGEGVTGSVVTLIDFGDGGTGARVTGSGGTANLLYRYRQNGTFTISVGATSTDRVTGFTSRTIEVTNLPPTVLIVGGDVTVALNETRIFVAEVSDPGVEDTHTFEWKLEEEALSGQESFAAGVTFSVPGEYELQVTATDSDGGTGTDSITVIVLATQDPAPVSPLNLARTGGAKHGPRPHDGEPQVFDAAPELQVRITGLAPGPSDTKGVVVRDQSQVFYAIENYLLPLINSPVFNAANLFEARRLLGGIFDAVVQRTATNAAVVNVLRQMDVAGDGTFRSIVEFRALGGPLEVEMLYRQGGQPFQLTTWQTNAPANAPVSASLDWTSLDATMTMAGQGVPPRHEALGLAAGDRNPPAVALIFNPATGFVTVLGQDNFTPSEELQFFLVQDNSGDGRLSDEVFYELATNQLARARLPSRPFAIVARDQAGNVTPAVPTVLQATTDFGYGNTAYCEELEAIRGAVRDAIQAGLNAAAVNDLFLLDRAHLWVFEQGSGACLWKDDSCFECNGNFLPGVSDNDYELFLPVHLERGYQMLETDRLEFLAEGPFGARTLAGDWYFRRPTGLDATGFEAVDPAEIVAWEYLLPLGYTAPDGGTLLIVPRTDDFTADLADGFPLPLTPAEVIARAFTAAVEGDPALSALLPETTFFPVRREHFMYGTLDLELPPSVGSDPIGDAGMGRQMLLLKWVLEGAFVPLAPALGVNVGLPSLEAVYQNAKAAGVPLAEGLEWGFFQEYAALSAGIAADAYAMYGPTGTEQPLISAAGNDLEEKRRTKLRKLGKAAIRAAFARLVGDPETASAAFEISRQGYIDRRLPSFEDYILMVCTNDMEFATQVFGEFARPRPTEEGPDLGDFLSLKRGDNEALLQEIARLPDGYRLFVEGGVTFLRQVQSGVYPAYTNYLAQLEQTGDVEELFRRARNINLVLHGQPPDRQGLNELRQGTSPEPLVIVVGIHNYANKGASNLEVQASTTLGGPALSPQRRPQDNGDQLLTIPDGAPLSGTALDDPEEALLTLEEPVAPGQMEVTTLTAVDPADFENEPTQADGRVSIIRTGLALEEPAPVNLPPFIHLFLNDDSTSLVDWPATETLPRSPHYYLRSTDRILVQVRSTPGLGQLSVVGRSELEDAGIVVTLAEVAPGIYESVSDADRFQVTDQPGDASRLYVKDEELLTFTVVTGGADLPELQRSVMVDAGEIAIATVEHADRGDNLKPRLDYDAIIGGGSINFFDAGYIEFPDDVAASVNGGDNAMRRFIQGFGDPARIHNGEADILYVHLHGARTGRLADHAQTNLFTAAQRTVLEPVPDLAASGRWRADAEWFISEACSILNPGIDTDLTPLSIQSGRTNWMQVLRSSPKPAHGILGFIFGKTASRPATVKLLNQVSKGASWVRSWEEAMDDQQMEWGWMAFRSATNDNLRTLSRQPLPTEPILFRNYRGVGSDTDCTDAEADCGSCEDFVELTRGVWVRERVRTLAAPAVGKMPRLVVLSVEPAVFTPLSRGQAASRVAELRPMSSGRSERLAVFDGPSATEVARQYLGEHFAHDGVELQWQGTGAVQEQLLEVDREHPPVITDYVVHFEPQLLGLRLHDRRVTVRITPMGIKRVSAQPLPLVTLTGDEQGFRDVRGAVETILAWHAQSGRACFVEQAELGWVLVRLDGTLELVPAWRLVALRPAVDGSPSGSPEVWYLNAFTAEPLEVEE